MSDDASNSALERAWESLQEGDVAGAQAIAEREHQRDPQSPEVLLLLAACCRGQGETARAMELLTQASQLAADWSAPELWLAEILADDMDQPAEALKHAGLALDRAEEEDEFLDALVLKAGLQIGLGKLKAARETLSELPAADEVELPADLALDLAYLFLEAGDREEANRRFRALVEAGTEEAEAWYGIGLVAEATGDEDGKRKAWLRVLAIDTAAPLTSEHLSEAEMAEVAESALKELPKRARDLIENVPILVVDLPDNEEVAQGLDPRLLGLFAGATCSDPAANSGAPQLTRILLFRKNLERMAIDADDLREQIRITLIHETGHFFGMSEEDLARVGLE
jgi:predicted Zn-dependent protease with MMP-like domain/thioredoxin-like negative regulator of GroEL